MLAALLVARGTEAEFQEAERLLIGDTTSTDPVAVEDRRFNAILMAQYGHPEQIERAVRILEELDSRQDGGLPGDRLILARLYENQARSTSDPEESAAKRALARKQLFAAASATEPETGHVMSLVDFLLRNNELEAGTKWLDKLQALLRSRPRDNPQSVADLVELMLKHGRPDLCSEWLDRLADTDVNPMRQVPCVLGGSM